MKEHSQDVRTNHKCLKSKNGLDARWAALTSQEQTNNPYNICIFRSDSNCKECPLKTQLDCRFNSKNYSVSSRHSCLLSLQVQQVYCLMHYLWISMFS